MLNIIFLRIFLEFKVKFKACSLLEVLIINLNIFAYYLQRLKLGIIKNFSLII